MGFRRLASSMAATWGTDAFPRDDARWLTPGQGVRDGDGASRMPSAGRSVTTDGKIDKSL
jgi:hypothetical protein